MDYNSLLMMSISGDELAAAKQDMVNSVMDWVSDRYRNIRLETIEDNIAVFVEMKKYDDQCKVCLSTQQCPTLDGNRINGRLAPDGIMNIWYEPCPRGFRIPKGGGDAPKVKRWGKKGAEQCD